MQNKKDLQKLISMKDFTASLEEDKFRVMKEWSLIKDRYKLKRVIGLSEMSQVLQARDRQTNKIVAIKLIKNVFDS